MASTPKKAANLTVRPDLLEQARELNINLSQEFEQHLAEVVGGGVPNNGGRRTGKRSNPTTATSSATACGAMDSGRSDGPVRRLPQRARPGNKRFPYLLVAQSDLLEGLRTCVVVPLGRASVTGGKSMDKLMPELQLDGAPWVMYTPELAALPASALRQKVANLQEQGQVILCALDFLFSGI